MAEQVRIQRRKVTDHWKRDHQDIIVFMSWYLEEFVKRLYPDSELKPPEVNPTTQKRTVTISMYPDVSGDYVCDGKNDEVEFKAALEYLQAIHDSDQKEAS